jgi:hypothetical protein
VNLKRTFLTAAVLAAATPMAHAVDLCRHEAVREAIRIEHDLRPVKEIYDIATNPTGFVIKTVGNEVGIRIPKWVGYAIDPRGAVRAEVMKRARAQLKKSAGLQDDCAVRAESAEEEGDIGPLPQPEQESVSP